MPKPESQNPVSEKEVLKIRDFVEKMGSLEKAKQALDALEKLRNAA